MAQALDDWYRPEIPRKELKQLNGARGWEGIGQLRAVAGLFGGQRISRLRGSRKLLGAPGVSVVWNDFTVRAMRGGMSARMGRRSGRDGSMRAFYLLSRS